MRDRRGRTLLLDVLAVLLYLPLGLLQPQLGGLAADDELPQPSAQTADLPRQGRAEHGLELGVGPRPPLAVQQTGDLLVLVAR